MTKPTQTILVVQSDPITRATMVQQLTAPGRTVLDAADGPTALQMVQTRKVRLVVTELYLETGESRCLIQAVRENRVRGIRTVALTVHGKSTDKDWARRWGASAFLIHPTATERLQNVASRLLSQPASGTRSFGISRRETLELALAEIERSESSDTLAIIFGRPWWDELAESQRSDYRKRAKRAGVTLRSDTLMSRQFVELRVAARAALAESSKPSPYPG